MFCAKKDFFFVTATTTRNFHEKSKFNNWPMGDVAKIA